MTLDGFVNRMEIELVAYRKEVEARMVKFPEEYQDWEYEDWFFDFNDWRDWN
jgi:hypothetical protein